MYVNTGSGEEGVLFWGLSPYDNNQQINTYKAQYGITNPCAGTEGGGPAAIDVVIDGQTFYGYPTYCVVCPDRTLYFDICWPPTEACFYPYFDMCVPPLLAGFSASDYDVCEGSEVQFTDESVGDIISWEWTFEGGTPETSTEQNPVVTYETAGLFDVSLIVSDGTNENTFTSPDVMQVDAAPVADAGSDGETCVNLHFTVEDAMAENAMMVGWEIISGEGMLEGQQTLSPVYTPAAEDAGTMVQLLLTAYGAGGCEDETAVSEKNLDIMPLPDVSLQPFDTVCMEWEPFELTGGMPEGGVYSGTGVEDGMFDPDAAGIGNHMITYTYTDQNGCENNAIEEIVVTSCVGIRQIEHELVRIYPNPSSGIFMLELQAKGTFHISVMNLLGDQILEKYITSNNRLDLKTSDAGIYLLKVSNGKYSRIHRLMIE